MDKVYYLSGKSSVYKNGKEIVKLERPIEKFTFLGFENCAYFIMLQGRFIKVDKTGVTVISDCSHCDYTSTDGKFGLYLIDKDSNPRVVAVRNGNLIEVGIYNTVCIRGRYCSETKFLFAVWGRNAKNEDGLFIYDETGTRIIYQGRVYTFFYCVNYQYTDHIFYTDKQNLYLYCNNESTILTSCKDWPDECVFSIENDDVLIKSENQTIYVYESKMDKHFLSIQTPFDLQLQPNKHYLFYSDNGSKESFFISCVYKSYQFNNFHNHFFNDFSKNYFVEVDKKFNYEYLTGMQRKNKFSIYGADIMEIIYNTDYNSYNHLLPRDVSIRESLDRTTIKYLVQQSGLSEAQLFWYLKMMYIDKIKLISQNAYDYLYQDTTLEMKRQKCCEEAKFKAYFETVLIDNGYYKVYPRRWKSEFCLYTWIKKYYYNAVFQYRPKWLKPQSLDIFIPDLLIAIEYQGLQHYQPVDFFGGDESFNATKARDRRKRQKCVDNGVQLFYWNYEIPVNQATVEEFIKTHEKSRP